MFQGEREMAADNKMLGQFNLEDIPAAPRGVPQIEVTFDIDANGIVNVSAKDKGTGKEQTIKIQASGGLSDDEVENMVKDAESNAEADKARRAAVEARNQGEAMIHQTEKQLSEHGDKVDEETKASIESAVAGLREVLDGDDAEAITAKTQELVQASLKLGEAVYQTENADPEAGGEASDDTQGKDDDIVDADFEEVKDDKK